MTHRYQRVVLSALIVALAVLIGVLSAQDQPPAIGSPAPDVQLSGLDGNTHSLSEYRGRIVVLEWTNAGCPVVQRHYKDGLMPALQKECLDRGVVWLIINSTNPGHANYRPAEDLRKIYGDWKASFTAYLIDPDGKAGKAFGAKTTPHMFIIDKEGKLAYSGAVDDDPQGTRPGRMNYIRLAVALLLKGKPVATTATKPYGCSVKYAD
jgi:glutathione peroxidase-family protein